MSIARRLRRARLAVLAVTSLTAVACSSTNQTARVASSPAPAASRAGEFGSVVTPAPGGAGGAAKPGGAAARKAKGGSGAGDLPRPGGSLDYGPPSQGVSADKISIGIELYQGFGAAAESLGVAGPGVPGDTTPASVQPTVDYINAHGGLGGRKVVPVYHSTDINRDSYDVQAQATCAAWTEDAKVFAGMTAQGWDEDTLAGCVAKRNTILLRRAVVLYDQTFADRYPLHFYQPEFVFGNRWAPYVDVVAEQGFLPAGSRVGILRIETPEAKRTTDQVIKPRLTARGIPVVAEATMPPYRSTAEGGAQASQVSNVVLRFSTERVDRVFFVEGSVSLPFAFMANAESQGYRPKYALNSAFNLAFLQGQAPRAQLAGSRGVAWWGLPSEAVANSASALCRDAVKGAYCAEFLFLKAALDRAPALNPAGFRAAVESLGTQFVSPGTWSSGFVRGHHQDGVSHVRPFAFDDGCGCFRFNGPPRPIA